VRRERWKGRKRRRKERTDERKKERKKQIRRVQKTWNTSYDNTGTEYKIPSD
jgi:hypothetical protein